MRQAVLPRRELDLCAMFNLLGLLTNPAGVTRLVVSLTVCKMASDGRKTRPMTAKHSKNVDLG